MAADKTLHHGTGVEKGEWPDWEPPEPPTFAIREEWTAPQRALRRLIQLIKNGRSRRPAAD
jgi:hypothetical protein